MTQLTSRSHFTTIHMLVQIQNLVSHSHTLVVQFWRRQLGVKRVGPDLRRVHRRGEADGSGYPAGIGQLGVLADPAVKVVGPELGLVLVLHPSSLGGD